MACPSFSLPARTTCPAAALCLKKAKAEGTEAICGRCYATKGRYYFSNVKTAQARRLEWWTPTHPVTRARVIAGLMTEAGSPKFFRCYDSGDMDRSAAETWYHLAELLPDTILWLPTKTWLLPEYMPDLISLNRHPRIVVRPSAVAFDDPPPKVDGLSAGTASFWKEPMKADVKCHEQCGAECRICWLRPDLSVSYKRK